MSKKYNPLKEVKMNIAMVSTEAVGYGVAGKIAGDIDSSLGSTVASKAFSTGSSLAGVPSLVYSSGTVLKSLKNLKIK